MRISTKGRYGLRIMLELSLHYDKDLLTVRTIAERQGISDKYIEQIISVLHKAGLVRSQRGAAGGYRLAEAPHEITVGQILRATEGGLSIVDCTSDNGHQCERQDECVTIDVWREIKEAVEDVVDHLYLSDLMARYHEKCSYNYVI